MGATNCGKTYLIDRLSEELNFFPVVVGKKLREMYPPDYFDGQAAPAKTDEIAYKLMVEGIEEGFAAGAIPVIDGQPRNQVQLGWCSENYFDNPEYDCKIVHLWAPRDVREERAKNRDSDPAKLKLSMDRMDGDAITLYDLWLQLSLKYADNMTVLDSTKINEHDVAEFVES